MKRKVLFLIRMVMKRKCFLLVLCIVGFSWFIPKPMESIENYMGNN